MTRSEWESSDDPQAMLNFVHDQGKLSQRKMRQFATACCRVVWSFLTNIHSRSAVEAAEQYADGLLSSPELRRALGRARNAVSSKSAQLAVLVAGSTISLADTYRFAWEIGERRATAILRDLFGPQIFQFHSVPRSVLAWNAGTVCRIAQNVYEERQMPEGALDTFRLAVLADAVMEAGCADEELIAHYRSEGPHFRGCWAVDVLLAKNR